MAIFAVMKNKCAVIALICALCCGCSPKRDALAGSAAAGAETMPGAPAAAEYPAAAVGNRPVFFLKASAFKMSGDYADHVAVTLDGDGNLVYFPAPTDLTAASRPVALGDGWWLNRQGISQNSVFTRYTFDQYMALEQVPTPQQLIDSIIPGARVTAWRTLPFPASDAINRLEDIKQYISDLQQEL